MAQVHNRADAVLRREDFRVDERFHHGNFANGRQRHRVVAHQHRAVGFGDTVDDARRGGDKVQVPFALQPLGDDVHVQQPQEAAAEAVAQCDGRFRVKREGSVVHAQLLQRIFERRIVRAVRRIHAAVDHRRHLPIAGQGAIRRIHGVGNCVADAGFAHILDGGCDIAYVARFQFVARLITRRERADFHNVEFAARRHHAHPHSRADCALLDADEADCPAVVVVERIENQCLQRRVLVALRRGNVIHNCFQHLIDVQAGFRAHARRVGRIQPDNVLNFLPDFFRLCAGQVNFIDDRDDFEVMVERHIAVRQRLRLNALRRVYHQQRAFARRQCTADFVGEVHVTGRVNQVERVGFAVLGGIVHMHRLGLDGDAALAFQLHAVQNLLHHLALLENARRFQNAVSQRGLAMVNMGDNAEIANLR